MKNKLYLSIGLYFVSFLLPVVELNFFGQAEVIYGWEIARDALLFSEDGIFQANELEIFYYVMANLANPLVLVTLILYYSKGDYPNLIYGFSILSIISALFWFPFFLSAIFDYFSFGYWAWLGSILMIHFYTNNSSFKRPSKNA